MYIIEQQITFYRCVRYSPKTKMCYFLHGPRPPRKVSPYKSLDLTNNFFIDVHFEHFLITSLVLCVNQTLLIKYLMVTLCYISGGSAWLSNLITHITVEPNDTD